MCLMLYDDFWMDTTYVCVLLGCRFWILIFLQRSNVSPSRARCWPHFVNDPIAVHPQFFKWDSSCSTWSRHSDVIYSIFYKWYKPILHVYDVNDLSKTVYVCNNLGKPSMLVIISILGGFLSHWFTKVIGRVFPSSLTPKLGWVYHQGTKWVLVFFIESL